MNTSYREQAAHFISGNQSAVAGAILFLFAFSLFAVNAVFNQPGNHPLPLWGTKEKIVTHSILSSQENSVPVRRVETSHFPARKIPVPVLRPLTLAPQPAPSEFAVGATSVEIANVQRLLEQLGFYSGPVDGLVGPRTKLAIRNFEHSKYLPESGDITPSLLLLLESATKTKHREGSASIIHKPSNTSLNGFDPAIITRIQVGLINFGNRDVTIDGVMGNQTRLAIRQFQKRFKLKVTGNPSKALIRKLESVGALTRK